MPGNTRGDGTDWLSKPQLYRKRCKPVVKKNLSQSIFGVMHTRAMTGPAFSELSLRKPQSVFLAEGSPVEVYSKKAI
jgi:hypothetical protein